jgi:phage protein D
MSNALKPPANAVSVASEGSFYVPAFEVRQKPATSETVARKLPLSVVRDVIQVTYKDNVNEVDSFELTINNWDARTLDFKYTGRGNPKDDGDAGYQTLFDPGKELELYMGYSPDLKLMISGQITTLEPNFPSSGAPTLAVRGLNILHQLRKKQYTDYWPKSGSTGIRDSDVARDIGHLKEKDGKRFPLPIRVDPHALAAEPYKHHVFQQNQYDIVFLMGLARDRGYVVFVEEITDKAGKPLKQLYFGPSDGQTPAQRDVTYRLEWGRSLTQFKPTLTTAKQIGSVTVRGWDRKKKKPIEVTVTLKDAKINSDLGDIEQAFKQREEVITDPPVYTEAEAKARAKDFLKNRLKEMVKASGGTVGLPDLRAGRRVWIGGVGSRFGGTYFVTDTTHTISESGYNTSFNARREEESTGGETVT